MTMSDAVMNAEKLYIHDKSMRIMVASWRVNIALNNCFILFPAYEINNFTLIAWYR